jgi:hypothetical protein
MTQNGPSCSGSLRRSSPPTRISLYGDGERSGYPEECRLCYNLPMLQGGYLRGADHDQKHSCQSCYPHTLSTSAALAAHRTHRHAIHFPAMNAFAGVGASPVVGRASVDHARPHCRDAHIRGLGHGSTSQGFHVVTFVKRLICRNARDKRSQIVFKMGQAGNGEKP